MITESSVGVEERKYLSRPEELLRFLKNMKILDEFELVWDQSSHGDFKSDSFVRKSGEPNKWLLKESPDSKFERITTEELVSTIISRWYDCGDLCLLHIKYRILYCFAGSEWNEFVVRAIFHEICSYTDFMNRNPICYQEEESEEEPS